MILLVKIKKRLADFFLQADFSIDLQTLAILGESGAGKSLLLKCIAGIENPDSGKIILGDRVLFDSERKINIPPQKRKIGYHFQNYALFPNMTVYQNISGTAKNIITAEEYLKRFGLSGNRKSFPHMLSGGEQQRLALARLLASEPEIFLFDEPFSALDSNHKSEFERLILELLEESQKPAILVTHDRNEAFRMAKNISVVEKGTFLPPLEKHEFFENPSTVGAAKLSGCKNISRLKWLSEKTAFALDWGIKLQLNHSSQVSYSRLSYAGFRAHYLELCDGKNKEENLFTCKIKRVIEDAFSFTVYFCQEENENSLSENQNDICWEVEKSLWKQIEKSLPEKKLYVKIPSDKIMLLEK